MMAGKKMRLTDLHCDTITTALTEGESMVGNKLHIDFERLLEYKSAVQVFSVWCADTHIKNAFDYANSAIDFFEREISETGGEVSIVRSVKEIEENVKKGYMSAVLALEGGEPLEGDLQKLEHFYNRGVRLVTLTWNRENELGHGVLSESTEKNKGLKPFGLKCVSRMNELGVIIDVSHLNEAGFYDVLCNSSKPFMASHSNAYSVCACRRNLTDWQIKAIAERGGLIGLNLYPPFLNGTKTAAFNDIFAHIAHFIKLDAINNVGLGCDLDGVDFLPEGIKDVSSLAYMLEQIDIHFGKNVKHALSHKSAEAFLENISKA